MIPVQTLNLEQVDLSVLQQPELPFEVKRVYFLSNFVNNDVRGQHAHINLQQVLIAIQGELEIKLFDKEQNSYFFKLNSTQFGLYVPQMFWRNLMNFSSNCILLSLASEIYNERDYIRDPKKFFN